MPEFPDYAQLSNLQMIESLYQQYLINPQNVDSTWRHFFEGIDFGAYLMKKNSLPMSNQSEARIHHLIQAYRGYGHLLARVNPLETKEKAAEELSLNNLGFFASELAQDFPTCGFTGKESAPLEEIIIALKEIYCGRIGFEFSGLGNPELIRWIQSRLEPKLDMETTFEEKHLVLEYLNRSEIFETFLHTKYPGQTRFSLEGAETMIPLIAEIVDYAGEVGVEEVLIGMAHRGRLNVLTNILNKSLETILIEFEDDMNLSFAGNDDVRYHMGFVGQFTTRSNKKVVVETSANPSHLESVDPVVLGKTYAKQFNRGKSKNKILPLLVHGDASIAGQGVIYECLQLMKLPNYSVGGSIHLVVNNQIGYTTLPQEGRSTQYCTDIAKSFGCPVFHVNAEDPESCLFAAKLAVEIRQKFEIDVFIDLLCYRKYGHNEGDEPSYTQPLEYETIRNKKSIRQIYVEQLLKEGKAEQKLAETLEIQFKDKMKTALAKALEKLSSGNLEKPHQLHSSFDVVATAVPLQSLQSAIDEFCRIPTGFNLHPKLKKWLDVRHASLQNKIDWATAECLAFGTLLEQGIPIRFAGQDSQRGTFSQRHMVWIDFKTGKPYCPLCHYSAPFQIVNSPLSEYACLGFEYGYSWEVLNGLNIWEAQYGDFFNGAEIIIDQYLVSADQKWNTPSSLTLLLPHGYEGSGPEHSSARIERFLQLAANQNIQVVYPSTPAQYFHLLRRQAIRKAKKPLIVFTPKSLLRAPVCTSAVEEFTQGSFAEVLDDPLPPRNVERVLFCTGKIFYELLSARAQSNIAILRIEQLYPLQIEGLEYLLDKYQGYKECIWVQEEPKNMGAWNYLAPYLKSLSKNLRYVGRAENATTATGSNKKHKQEQADIIKLAFGES